MSDNSKVLRPKFGKKFMADYSGKMTNDPKIAIVELVANAWDAGAKRVDITWPESEGLLDHEHFEIKDDGTGMTEEEFRDIWTTLGYDRRTHQDSKVIFPNGEKIERKAYGHNGKGRLSLFCFTDKYTVKTCKDGTLTTAKIKKKPIIFYEINMEDGKPSTNYGTSISCLIYDNWLKKEEIINVLSSRFGADPNFEVFVNGSKVDMFDLEVEDTKIIDFAGKKIEILKVLPSKDFSEYNVVWLVNNRRANLSTWKDLDIYLERKIRNKYTFLVKADFLEDDVKADWSGFKDTDLIKNVKLAVKTEIKSMLGTEIKKTQHERKIKAVKESITVFNELTPVSKVEVGKHIDQILEECPTITNTHLSYITKILAKIEVSKRGFQLLEQLVSLKEDELDKLSEILEKWSINDAYYVLGELYDRLRLIKELEILVEDPKTLELKQLQPLFKKGLWIFGPEYEGTTNFTSNQTLNIVMRDLLKRDVNDDLENSEKRPDFVVLESDSHIKSTLGVFSSKAYDDDDTGEVDGYRKILILELKRGGSTIGYTEFSQANYYSSEIDSSGKLQGNPKIITYVLGANVSPKLKKDNKIGDNIKIRPRTYDDIISKAKARTLNLIENLENVTGITDLEDPEITEALSEDED